MGTNSHQIHTSFETKSSERRSNPLEAILFCLDEQEWDDLIVQLISTNDTQKTRSEAHLRSSLDAHPLSSACVQIHPGKTPKLERQLCPSGLSNAQLPLSWQSAPAYSGALVPAELKRLSLRLQYLFKKGEILTAQEIFFFQESKDLSHRLLPLLRTRSPLMSLDEEEVFPFRFQPQLGSQAKKRKLEQLLLEWSLISVLLHSEPVPVFLVKTTTRNQTRFAISISEIKTLKSTGCHWQMDHWKNSAFEQESLNSGLVSLSFIEKSSQADRLYSSCFEFDPKNRKILFHIGLNTFETQRETLVADSTCVLNAQAPLKTSIWLKSHHKIKKTIQALERPSSQTVLRQVYTIQESQIQNHCWVEKSGNFVIARSFLHPVDQKTYWLSNFPECLNLFLGALRNGLQSLFNENIPDFPFIQGRSDRDNKFMRHGGLFGFLLLETASYYQTPPQKRPKHEAFRKGLFLRLTHLFVQIEKKAGFVDLSAQNGLEGLCSIAVIQALDQFLDLADQGFNNGVESVFWKNTELKVQGGWSLAFKLIFASFRQIQSLSKGTCFFKPRFPWLNLAPTLDSRYEPDLKLEEAKKSKPQAISPYPLSLTHWNFMDLLYALAPLRSSGDLQLYYQNQAARLMSPEEFRPILSLKEIPSSKAIQNSQDIDWFELNPRFFFQDHEVQLSDFHELTRKSLLHFDGQFFLAPKENMHSLKRLEHFWETIEKQNPEKKRSKDPYYPLARSYTLEMLALRKIGIHLEGGARWNHICQFYDKLDDENRSSPATPGLKANLKDYQKKGLRWLLDLYELGLGGILADDMGLGKTIQTLAFLEVLREEKQLGRVLIVVPTSLTYNWFSESQRFTPLLPIQLFQSRNPALSLEFLESNPQSALVITYGLFTEHLKFLEGVSWNIHIFDEAQSLKNISAKRTTASRKVKARFKLCLTGTPLENHLGEFFSLMDLVVPGCLGELSNFRDKFIRPAVIEPTEIQGLKLKSRPLILRRTKDQILSELPPKIETTIKLPFEIKQERIYRDIAVSWNDKVRKALAIEQGQQSSQLLMLTALLRLRQACSDPAAIPNVRYPDLPPKVETLMESLEEIVDSGQSALVFTQFLHTFERIRQELTRMKLPFFCMHGATSRQEREKVLTAFQNCPTGSVLLMTLKTGGVGLNLIKASYVFHLEPWWNPAVENQATDRAHRMGQERPVQVYRFLMRESVEEKIELLKARKSAQFNALFSNEENPEVSITSGSKLSQADFEYLLLSEK